MIEAVNKASGEVISLPADTPEEILQAWLTAQEYDKVAQSLKAQLKELVPSLLKGKDESDPIQNYTFKRSLVQKQTYDKQAIRDLLDEDTLDLFTKVQKSAVDAYIKEHSDELGDVKYELKKALVPDGKAYEVIKLQKFSAS